MAKQDQWDVSGCSAACLSHEYSGAVCHSAFAIATPLGHLGRLLARTHLIADRQRLSALSVGFHWSGRGRHDVIIHYLFETADNANARA